MGLTAYSSVTLSLCALVRGYLDRVAALESDDNVAPSFPRLGNFRSGGRYANVHH